MSDAYANTTQGVCKYCAAALVRRKDEAAYRFATRLYCNKHCNRSWWGQKRNASIAAKNAGLRHCRGCGKPLVRKAKEKFVAFWHRSNCDRTCADIARSNTHVTPVYVAVANTQAPFVDSLDAITRDLLLESFEMHPEFLEMLVNPGVDSMSFLGFTRPR